MLLLIKNKNIIGLTPYHIAIIITAYPLSISYLPIHTLLTLYTPLLYFYNYFVPTQAWSGYPLILLAPTLFPSPAVG